MGVPLHVALRGIEKAFDSWEAKPRKRTIKTLVYCQEEVEAQYTDWLESRVGAPPSAEVNDTDPNDEATTVFSRSAVLEHLRNAQTKLEETREQRTAEKNDDFADSLSRAVNLLSDLEAEFSLSTVPDTQKLEVSLTGVERMLSEALLVTAAPEQIDEMRREIKKQLRPYRSHMETAIYEQTFNNLLLKRLREQFSVPRLSLFYL